MFTINLAIVCGTTFCGCYMMLLFLCIPIAPDVSYSTMWCPPVINLFINLINYSYKYYKPQSSYVSCIGVKGDTPYLAKTRQFSRNFARKPTASSSKKPCEGICHQCDAGGEDLPHSVPFEQLGVQEPVWLQTVGLDDCAEPGSPFRQIPSERDGTPGSFVQLFRYDLFHNI